MSLDEEENVYYPILFKFNCSSQSKCCFGKHFGYHTRGNLGDSKLLFLNKVLFSNQINQALFRFATSACKAPPTLLKTGYLLLILQDSAPMSLPGGGFLNVAGRAGHSLCSHSSQGATQQMGLSPCMGLSVFQRIICFRVWTSREETVSFYFFPFVQTNVWHMGGQVERLQLFLGDFLPTGSNTSSQLPDRRRIAGVSAGTPVPANPAFKNKQLCTFGNRRWPSRRPPSVEPRSVSIPQLSR